ncbi:sensor histidine kinase [Actinoallomurus iriomotensis]|uniref:histidine kinase n=1 Tax=Actinoallomurus iriomotensis TaxID=478107 RepID=A0A9W6S6I7_9ACTN|nr:histidine kinase [Actinoallomurus iriomotensis]GLY86622.1 two-component sensor histidine kinase [Actinoallomurus iriomotensis]
MAGRAAFALARRPVPQDAALACVLFVVCLLVNDPIAMVNALADGPVGGGWSGPGVWWSTTVLTLLSVTLRRRWPVPMLVLCLLSAGARLAAGAPVAVVDLAVLVLLYTVASRCSRVVSLSALGVLLLCAIWATSGSLAGRPFSMLSFHFKVCKRVATSSGPAPRADDVDAACRGGGSGPWGGLPVLGSGLVAAWAVGSGSRNRRAYLEQLHERARDLERERDQQAALTAAAERGRISREVHDVVAHGLSLIVIQAQGAEAALDNRPADTRSALRTIVKTGRDSLADMRRVLAALGEVEDAWHPQPGLAELPGLVTRVREAGTPVRLRVEGSPAALPSTVDLSAYRIVQEALTNVMKHAGADAAADVVVSYTDTELIIEVSDDGRGAAGTDGGNGLPGMRRRVELLGGRLSTGPGAQGGFVVRAGLPIQGQHA